MAYHGLLRHAKMFLSNLNHSPHVLEVGVDRGVSLITLAVFLARTRKEFVMTGVDVMIQEQVSIMVNNLDLQPGQNVDLIESNSLVTLPRLVEEKKTYDLIMIDGDHNYHTVKSELEHLDVLLRPGGLVFIDDYEGKWSERDMWYAQRPGYEENTNVTKPFETRKHGVKPAVDEWLLEKGGAWLKSSPVGGEPIVLYRMV